MAYLWITMIRPRTILAALVQDIVKQQLTGRRISLQSAMEIFLLMVIFLLNIKIYNELPTTLSILGI